MRGKTARKPLAGEKPSKPLVILFNKPFEVLCQFTDREGRANLSDFIPVGGVYAAGRLDYDSEGLVVLTNSGALQNLIAEPRNKLPKAYLVQVEGTPDQDAIERLRSGVLLKDGMTRKATVEVVGTDAGLWPRVPPIRFRKSIPETWLKVTITEGRNRQVRRMTASVGHPALRLVRVSVGPWSLEGLKPGEWKEAPFPEELMGSGSPARTKKR